MRLARARRWKAGWLLAFVYFLCVLAPTISFALPGSHAVSPCLTDASHAPGIAHIHAEAQTQHIHYDGHVHDHATAHSHANPDGDRPSMPVALDGKPASEKTPHSSNQQCCGLMCITALPATLMDIGTASEPPALCDVESYRKVTDNAPPRLYRPPIF